MNLSGSNGPKRCCIRIAFGEAPGRGTPPSELRSPSIFEYSAGVGMQELPQGCFFGFKDSVRAVQPITVLLRYTDFKGSLAKCGHRMYGQQARLDHAASHTRDEGHVRNIRRSKEVKEQLRSSHNTVRSFFRCSSCLHARSKGIRTRTEQ